MPPVDENLVFHMHEVYKLTKDGYELKKVKINAAERINSSNRRTHNATNSIFMYVTFS